MFSRRTFGRNFAMAALALALSACQMGPRERVVAPPQPPPPPSGPSANVLPTDSGRHRVALLVPLSGEDAAVGQSIANATQMAILDTNATNLRITTYDTAANPRSAAAQAIRDGNKLILGPLLREAVPPIEAEARGASVPLIAFTNDTSAANANVFVMGHSPEQSIARTVDYARAHGIARFGALVPNGDYGDRAAAALEQSVRRAGGSVADIEHYDRANTSIISAANRLKTKGGYDAVLIADSPRISAMGAGPLVAGGARPRILGTERWSGEASVTTSPALRGAWFSAVSDARFRQFSASYKTRFGEAPRRLATLGYDAVLLTLRIARDWQPGRNFPTGRMTAPDGFIGLDGPFRFRANGVGERSLEVRQVGAGAVTVVDPAAGKF